MTANAKQTISITLRLQKCDINAMLIYYNELI